MNKILLLICLLTYTHRINISHSHSDTITWLVMSFLSKIVFRMDCILRRSWNTSSGGSTATSSICERFSCRYSYPNCKCTDLTIVAKSLISDINLIRCATSSCSSWTPMNTKTSYTDCSSPLDVSSSEYYQTQTFSIRIFFIIHNYSSVTC